MIKGLNQAEVQSPGPGEFRGHSESVDCSDAPSHHLEPGRQLAPNERSGAHGRDAASCSRPANGTQEKQPRWAHRQGRGGGGGRGPSDPHLILDLLGELEASPDVLQAKYMVLRVSWWICTALAKAWGSLPLLCPETWLPSALLGGDRTLHTISSQVQQPSWWVYVCCEQLRGKFPPTNSGNMHVLICSAHIYKPVRSPV